jgi:hypothetical protein
LPELETVKAEHLEGMLRCLGREVRFPRKAKQCLERYWRDQAAVVWTVEQVHRAANERRLALTQTEARHLLHRFVTGFDPFVGQSWFTLLEFIQHSGSGRSLTPTELHRLLEHNHLTVAKPR